MWVGGSGGPLPLNGVWGLAKNSSSPDFLLQWGMGGRAKLLLRFGWGGLSWGRGVGWIHFQNW